MKRWKLTALILLLVIASAAGYGFWRQRRLEIYQKISSPDARYYLLVYRRPLWPATMPGQAGDAPGVVRLYDRSGRLLNEAPIDMVQHLNDLEWSAHKVEVPLVFRFSLP